MSNTTKHRQGENAFEVFLSYEREGQPGIARQLYQALQGAGIRVFMDETEIPSGSDWIGTLEAAMRQVHTFLLLRTRADLSPWVQLETRYAIIQRSKRSTQRRLRIIPVVPVKSGEQPELGSGFVDTFQSLFLELGEDGILPASLERLVQEIQRPRREDPALGYPSAVDCLARLVAFNEQVEHEVYSPRERLEERIERSVLRLQSSGGAIALFGPTGIGKKWTAWHVAQKFRGSDPALPRKHLGPRTPRYPGVGMWLGTDPSPRQALQELVASASLMLNVSVHDGLGIDQWLAKMDAGLQLVSGQLLEQLGSQYGTSESGPVVVPVLDITPGQIRWLPSPRPGVVFLVTASDELPMPPGRMERVFYEPADNDLALERYALDRLSRAGFSEDKDWATAVVERAGRLFAPVAYALESTLAKIATSDADKSKRPAQLDAETLIPEDWQAGLFARARNQAKLHDIRETELKALLGVLTALQVSPLTRSFVRGLFQAALAHPCLRTETIDWRSLYDRLDEAIDSLQESFLEPTPGDLLRPWQDAVDPYVHESLLTDSEQRCCHALIAFGCWEAWRQRLVFRPYAARFLLSHLKSGLPHTADAIAQALLSDFLLEAYRTGSTLPIDLARGVLEPLLTLTRDEDVWRYHQLKQALVDLTAQDAESFDRRLRLSLILAMAGETAEIPIPSGVEQASRSEAFLVTLGVSAAVALDLVRSRGLTPSVEQLISMLAILFATLPPDRLSEDMGVWLSGQANGLTLALDSAERFELNRDTRYRIAPMRHRLGAAAFDLFAAKSMLRIQEPPVWENLLWRAFFAQRQYVVVSLVDQMPVSIRADEPDFAAENYRIAARAAISLWRREGAARDGHKYLHFLQEAKSQFDRYMRRRFSLAAEDIPTFPGEDSNRTTEILIGQRPALDGLILTNEYDAYLGLALEAAIRSQGMRCLVVQLTSLPLARNYTELKAVLTQLLPGSPLVMLLGGPKSPQGIGHIVSSVLQQPSQHYLLWSEEFRGKRLILQPSERLLVIAGNGRVATREAVEITIDEILQGTGTVTSLLR